MVNFPGIHGGPAAGIVCLGRSGGEPGRRFSLRLCRLGIVAGSANRRSWLRAILRQKAASSNVRALGGVILFGNLEPMPLVDPVHRFVLFTNAKCGGTTLKAWYFDNLDFASLHRKPATLLSNYGLRYAAAHIGRGSRLARGVARAMRAAPGSEEYKRKLRIFIDFYRQAYCRPAMVAGPPADFQRICVVRHPAQRLVSAYLDKFCTPRPDGHRTFERKVLQAIGRPDPSFWQLLDYLEGIPEEECNPHWRRQTYVPDGQRIDSFV